MAAGWVWRWLIHTFSLRPSDWLLWRSSDSSWLSVEVTHTHLLSAPFWLTIVEVLRLKQLLVIPSSFWLLRTSLCLIVGGLAQEPSGTRVQRSTAARLCAGYIILSTTGRRRPWPSSHDLIRLYNFITNIYHIHYHNKPGGKGVASFAGLPHFCHLVCVQYNTNANRGTKTGVTLGREGKGEGEGEGGGGNDSLLLVLLHCFQYSITFSVQLRKGRSGQWCQQPHSIRCCYSPVLCIPCSS